MVRVISGWLVAAASLMLVGWASDGLASDWARFRGPDGSGVSPDTNPMPVRWSPTENLKWKVDLPGAGSSSPILVGDRIYVTCWSGYGVDRNNPGDQSKLVRHLVCLDKKTGETIWKTDIEPVLPEDEYGGMFAEHGYASHTPICDGERIYVFFGKTGAMAFDMNGAKLWQSPVGKGSDPRGWGSASSPVLYKNLVIVTASAESEAIVGLDKATGKEVWRQEAGGLSGTWGTPLVVKVDDERTDLVLGVPFEVWGLNPETGKLRWYCEAMQTDSFCSSLVESNGVVFGIEGRGGGSIAVKVGGKGDVAPTNVVWSGRHNNRISTPVVYQDRVYFFANGVAGCLDAKTGKEIFQSRLTAAPADNNAPAQGEAGKPDTSTAGRSGFGRGGGRGFGGDYASPVLADGKVYFVRRSGETYVLTAGDKFEQLAVNRVTEDREDFSATPAVSDGELFLRSSKRLYCVAQKSP